MWASEASAVGNLRTLNIAEMTYASTYHFAFCQTLGYLAPPSGDATPSSTAAGLIDEVLVSGTKSGYSSTYSPGSTEPNTKQIRTYVIHASPITKSTGTHYFTDQSGVIRQDSMLAVLPIGD